jgi:sarcosine oxidase
MTYDTIILGLGAMGSSALFHLARRGRKVLGIEQFDIAHDRGSSHGRSRMIRLAYYEHPDYVPLLRRAYELWDELSADAEEQLLYRTGGLYLGSSGCELVEGSLRSAREHRLPHELIDRDAIKRRFPQFEPPADAAGLYEPSAGFLLPERAIATNVRLAKTDGAEFRTGEHVIYWEGRDDYVVVQTDRETYTAGHLIIAGGSWTSRLCRIPILEQNLRVTRQVLAWFEPLRDDLQVGQFPVWAIDHPAGGIHYGFPVHPADEGFKAAFHFPRETAHPDALDRLLRPDDEAAIRETVDQWLPNAAGRLVRHAVCMYTNTPDGHFVLDRHPEHRNIVIASCCSGHGFKFSSVIGEILADLATRGRTEHPIDLFKVSRLSV